MRQFDNPPLLQVGKIGRAHGYRGEVRVYLYNNTSELLHPNTTFYLNDNPNLTISIESARPADKFYLVCFEQVFDREEAQKLTNSTLSVDRSVMPPTSDDEYYCVDLINFDVFATHENSDLPPQHIGFVSSFLDQVETDVMIVEGPKLPKRWLIPFIESVILRVDMQDKKILLAPLHQWTHEDQVLDEEE